MAKPVKDKDLNVGEEKKGFELNQTTMMIINNLIMLVVIIVSLAVMYILLNGEIDKKLSKYMPQDEQEETGDEDTPQEGLLIDLGDFVLNLADAGAKRYLKVGVAVELSQTSEEIEAAQEPAKGEKEGKAADPQAAIVASMERYKPAIRDAVISVISSKTSDEISSPIGKELAKEEITQAINSIFDGQREVLRVSFGQFVIQ